MAPHSPSAASSPSQEPPQAAAEAELPVSAAREQKLLKWPNFSNFLQTSVTSTVVVCVASVAVTLVIMATLGIRAFIECPKQISELAQRLIMTNSDFARVLTECYEERSDLKQQLRNATFNFIAAINELKDVRKIVEEYAKITAHLKEKLCLIKHVALKQKCAHLLEKAVQDLKHVYSSYDTVDSGIKKLNINNLRLQEVADNCTNWLKQLEEEYLDLQTIHNSHVTLLIEESQLRINNGNLQFYAKNESTLKTKIQYLREFVDNCTKDLRERNVRLQTINTCCTKVLKEENLKLQTINTSYATLLSEVNQLNDMKDAIKRYLILNKDNQELKKLVKNQTNIENEMRNCTENSEALRAIANKFPSVWDHCDNQTLKCSPCMTNWVNHSSSCFFLSSDSKSWPAARAECVRLGGDLAVVPSLSEQTFLTTLVKNGTVNQHSAAWIGVSDLIVKDIFHWVNGTLANGGYWGMNTAVVENHCVAIVAPAKIGEGNWIQSWNVLNCSATLQYICETSALGDHANAATT